MIKRSSDNLSRHSIIYEYNVCTENMKQIHVLDNDFMLNDLVANDKYIYMAISIDADRNVLLRVDRATYLVEIIWEFYGCLPLSIEAIFDDLFGLIYVLFRNNHGVDADRFDLINIENKSAETIYVRDQDNMDFFTEKLFLAIKDNNPIVIIDRHINPSDKAMSNGLADEIAIL